jgi:hypothetical protein
MTPHEPFQPDDEDHPFARAFLVSLQLVAMGLVVMVLAEMAWQEALNMPHSMCVEAPPGPVSNPTP